MARVALWAACLQWLPRATLAVRFKQAALGNDNFPHHDINLDLPPRQRWKHLVPKYKDWCISILQQRKAFLDQYNWTQLREFVAAQQLDEEYIEEIKGLLEEINHPEATLEMSILGHMRYELGMTQHTECSAILAAMENGTVVQGRNLDLSSSYSSAKPGMIRATFWRKGEPIFTAQMAFGSVAVGDAMRFGSWSVQQNTRRTEGQTTRHRWMEQTIDSARRGARLYAFELRRLLADEPSYSEVLRTISTTKFSAPFYSIIAGSKPYEGAVISIDRYSGGVDPVSHDVMSLSPTRPRGWYLVQTNDDHWRQPEDSRRNSGKMSMAMLKRSRVGADSIFQAMRKAPVCNKNTWYTWVAIPALSTFDITDEPCLR